ncbi:hypothetical protein J4464_01410 [Candidatus Woesearchaeota archaeon]|nr:hypothetical protein [Candidatus Woesearchaeota archaeon]
MSMALSFFVPLILCVLFGLFYIPLARKIGIKEFVLLQSFKKKQGTPTMGGIIILLALVASLPFLYTSDYFIILVFATLFFAIGVTDDALKITRRSATGLRWRTRLILQFILAVAFCIVFYYTTSRSIPYLLFNGLFLVFFVNAFNITDGLDGMAAGNFIIILSGLFFILLAIASTALVPFVLAVIGATAGFLVFNAPRAKLFMGDAGASLLGSLLAMIAIFAKLKYFVFIAGLFIVIEGGTSIVQILSRMVLGRTLFPIAPFHYVLLRLGWGEQTIAVTSWIFTLTLTLVFVVASL